MSTVSAACCEPQCATLHSFREDEASSLPHEILEAIFRKVTDKRHLNALCRVSKLFHRLTIPLLYESLEIECPQGYNPRNSILKHFSAKWPDTGFTSNLKHVRDLALTTEFSDLFSRGYRCWHRRIHDKEPEESVKSSDQYNESKNNDTIKSSSMEADARGTAEADETDDESGSENSADEFDEDEDEEPNFYEDHFRDFCLNLSENGLRSFRWELGACVPQNILGPAGYLTQCQPNIEQLSLITDGACDDNMEISTGYDLASFSRIRDFSWIGPCSAEDFEAIRDCFIKNATHLEALKLNLVDWSKADDFWFLDDTRFSEDPDRRANFFAQDILCFYQKDGAANRGLSFPALRSLYLGQLSFRYAISDLVSAFNVSALQRLVLWNCPGTVPLLKHLTASKKELQLASFELTWWEDNSEDIFCLSGVVPPFIRKLTGVQVLCLNLPVYDWGEIVDAVCLQLATLERVALHSRTVNTDWGSAYFNLREDKSVDFYSSFYNLFSSNTCEVIGMQNPPSFVRENLEPYAQDVACKLLHLRASEDSLKREDSEFYVHRSEVDNFAEWAFGPQGLQQLLVFAYGDFAFARSCQSYNVFYCRANSVTAGADNSNYKILTPSDKDLWDWVTANMDVLSACPYRSIVPV